MIGVRRISGVGLLQYDVPTNEDEMKESLLQRKEKTELSPKHASKSQDQELEQE